MAKKPRRHLFIKIVLVLVLIFILGLVGLYYTVQSPRFLRFLVNRLNDSISGEITYKTLHFDLDNRHILIENLSYKNLQGETIVALENLDLNFKPFSVIRARLDISRLRVTGLNIDQGKEPKKAVPSTWRSTLRLILKRVSISDALLEKIHLKLRTGDEFYFDQATITITKQLLARQKVDFWVNESFLKPGNLEIRSSTLSFQGEVQFPVFEDFSFLVENADGKLRLSEITIGKLPATSLESDFAIKGDTLSLKNGILSHADGAVQINVDYTPSKKAYVLDLKTARPFPLSSVPKIHKELLETFDRFDLELKADLKGYRLREITGDVSLKLRTFGNTANPATPQNDLTLSGQMQNGVLKLKNFLVQSAKTQVTATGSIDFPGKKLDVNATAKNFDLATMVEAIGDLDLVGYADAKGTIRGNFKYPDFQFTATARETGYSFMRFGEITGDFKIIDNVLSFVGGTLPGAPGRATVQVKTENIFKKEKRTTVKTEYSNLDASMVANNPELKGRISGTFEMQDTWETPPNGLLKARIDDFQLLDFQLGELNADGKLGNRQFIIGPVTFQPPNYEKLSVPKPVVFTFDDKGLKVTGEMLPGVAVTGHFTYNTKVFYLDATAKNFDLRPLEATLLMNQIEAYADGTVKLEIGLAGAATKVDILANRLLIPLEEGDIREAEPISISIRPPQMIFNKARFRSERGNLNVTGAYVMDGNSNLGVQGKIDLGILKMYPKLFREGFGQAEVDLKLSGNLENPQAVGDITFEDAGVTLRIIKDTIEDLTGKIKLTGKSVSFENLKGSMAEGDIRINGQIELEQFTPRYYDLKIEAREASLSDPGVYRMIFSGDFTLKGPAEGPTLTGTADITDGKYTRNFNIAELLLKPEQKAISEGPNPFLEKLRLNLHVRSPGELAIRNNVARMFLQSDLKVAGLASKPTVTGALEVLDGEFNYFKINFQNAKGTIDFRDARRGPYVDITASKEFVESFNSVTVFVQIRGYTENLRLSFSSDSGLEKRDIIALVFTGSMRGGSGFTGTQIAGAVIASQLTSILQSTVGKSGQLDVIRLENAGQPGTSNFSTLVVGKKLTDRVSLEFKTDLGIEDPLQGVQMEYLLFDNMLLKASQLTDGSFNFNFTLRWRSF